MLKKNLDFRLLKKNKNKQKRKQEDLATLSPDFYKQRWATAEHRLPAEVESVLSSFPLLA